MNILNETQAQRDEELVILTSSPIDYIINMITAHSACISIWQGNKQPKTDQEYKNLYIDYEYLNFTGYLKTLMFTSINRRHPELISLLKNTRNRECLDFGSGVGTHSIALMQNENQVSCLDVKGRLSKFCQQRVRLRKLKEKYFYYNSDDLPNSTFDLVICSDVLEHTFDPLSELKNITKSLKKDGTLCLIVSEMVKPSSGHFKVSISKWVNECKPYLLKHFKKIGKVTYKKL